MTRQRLPKEERKHQIQEAAKGIILEKGYENTTMDEVIEKSGMSTGGVYHYYKSVYEIFYDIMAEGLDYGDKRLVNVNKNINSFVNTCILLNIIFIYSHYFSTLNFNLFSSFQKFF